MTNEGRTDSLSPRRASNIRDVAAAAGVSYQTVSRVINGHPSLRDSTRQRVLEAMEQLQFRPNRAARALVTRESRIIGALVASGAEYGPTATLQAVQNAANEAGYVVDAVHIDNADRSSIEEALDRLMSHAVEGLVLLAPQSRTLEVIEQLSIRIPFVTVHSLHSEDHRMSVDQLAGARLATRALLELGHRKVVHVPGPEGWVETEARRQGYLEEMTAWGLAPAVVSAGEWTAESGYRVGAELRNGLQFSAVFSGNDHIALGLVHAFAEAGLRVPEDVSVVGFDDVPEAAHFLPPLTTVRQDFPELGRRCVAVLLGELQGRDPVKTGDVAPKLVRRGSTAAPPASFA
ncbi:LacI family DNA-binding transcriptional regulator [Arthrobacter sp. zg-Y411]|uniref:LacI family DNA-binding transcriptional regulator n=1 Tax=Arthrobacter TaxID=1663 RepID=UPI001D1576E0|nr:MULTISPECIES: LacI family DNA-binding transcriptional regulator [Arthrobacter]MCC3294443.1 LacI family DNA-binding transcriptional regulator [Arthrobacter zhangbolii]MDN3903135.1 LacI family DNA-binding transcriptional regulator [Arthrobacter sp. YD2]